MPFGFERAAPCVECVVDHTSLLQERVMVGDIRTQPKRDRKQTGRFARLIASVGIRSAGHRCETRQCRIVQRILLQEFIEATQRAVVRKFDARNVERRGRLFLRNTQIIARVTVQNLGIAIDEALYQRRTSDTIEFWVFASDPFHGRHRRWVVAQRRSMFTLLQHGRIIYMIQKNWLLLIINLPGRNQTLRMRVWRALTAAGAAALRDGVYALPNSEDARRIFEEQGRDIQSGGGSAHVLSVNEDSTEQHATLIARFDRTDGYRQIVSRLDALKREVVKLKESEARRRVTALRREVAAIVAIDFFSGESRKQTEAAMDATEKALNARFSPDEPLAAHTKIVHRNLKDYRGRTWTTREHMWIDRVCSAWLIRRFIDPKAKFVWLKRIGDQPKNSVGFDFNGAEFTHVGAKVTFEVLLQSFRLEHDEGLTRLGALVHYLDVGGIPVAEAAGFSSIVAGARSLAQDDDALLTAIGPVIDCLYASYSGSNSTLSGWDQAMRGKTQRSEKAHRTR